MNLMKQIVPLCFVAFVELQYDVYAQVLQNGSFESASVDPRDGFITLYNGSRAIEGWTVTGGNIDYVGTYWLASDGSRAMDLNGSFATGAVSQSFTTAKDSLYQIKFDMAGNVDGGPTLKRMRVSAGTTFQEYAFDVTGRSNHNLGWQEMVFKFRAVSQTTTLTFASLISGSYGPAIDNVRVIELVTSINDRQDILSIDLALHQNYPNPFNPETRIQYQVPRKAMVRLEIFNLYGQLVTALVEGEQTAGEHSVVWNGKDDHGTKVPSGVYFYRLVTEKFTAVRKMILMK